MTDTIYTLPSQVISRVNNLFSDSSNSKWTAEQKLEAVNMAIDAAWPSLASNNATSFTLVSGQEEYVAGGTEPALEYGYSVAYVTIDDENKMLMRRLKQRLGVGAITIIVPTDYLNDFAGETVTLLYRDRVARVSNLLTNITLPLDYLWKATAYFLCQMAMVSSAHFDTKPYEQLIGLYEKEMSKSLLVHQRNQLPSLIPIVAEVGSGAPSGRYGQNIINNP